MEVEELTAIESQTRVQNVELEHEIQTLVTKIGRMHEDHKSLEDQLLDEKTKYDKVVKRNLLIDELNKDMMEMNIEDLCKFINQSLYQWVHQIRRSNIKEIIKTGDKVLDKLKDQGLKDVTQAIENIITQFEHLRDKKSEAKLKQEKGS